MKPPSVINQGEHFTTLRVTTENPLEIREALADREIQQVFKGDQNQAWDAVLSNHCLARAVGRPIEGGVDLTLFVHDERLGTSDARFTRQWREAGRRHVLTEDYYRGRTGAVWEHQDVSYGLFFTEAVSPEQYAAGGVHLHRAAALWERHSQVLLQDAAWRRALAALGVTFPQAAGPALPSPDAATRLGPAVETDALGPYFRDHPAAALYYAFTKTDGLYGIVPVENENLALSGIPFGDPEIQSAARWLLVQVAARGALRMAALPSQQRAIRERTRRIAAWAEQFLRMQPDASVADFQAALGRWLTGELFPADRIELDRSSRFARITAAELPALASPEETLHFFLDLALRHPAEFSDAYNDALNRVGLGLQRMKHDPATGLTTLPFFVEYAPGGAGTPIYRFELELTGTGTSTILLRNPGIGDRAVAAGVHIRSARELVTALLEGLQAEDGVSLVGKAAAFSAELQRAPRGLGLPRQGSKYTPIVDHLLSGLRSRGLLPQPAGLLIRIGLNAMDRLEAMGEFPLRLPRFLHGPLGRELSCRTLAASWRRVAAEAQEMLEALGRCPFGQYVHLVRLLAGDPGPGEATPPIPYSAVRLARALRLLDPDGNGGAAARLGEDLDEETRAVLRNLLNRREQLLAERRAAAAEAPGHLREPQSEAQREDAREQVECGLLLLFAAYVRRLWQRAESLPYVNDRPYTLALYLLFGGDIFPPICRNVVFDVEYLDPRPPSAVP